MICGKQIFHSRSDAAAHMAGGNKAKLRSCYNRLSITYFCKDCNGWHVSSKTGNKISTNKKNVTEDLSKPVNKMTRGVLVIKNYSSKKI